MENKNFIKNIFIIIIVLLAALYLIKAFDISYPITITSTTKSSELSVVGEGKIEVVPDTAYVDAGITINNVATVDEAQKTINKINNDIISAMKGLGIERGDIKTSNYSIYPNYKYENNENKINGYNGNATIEIRVRDPQMASRVIEEATKAGANQIQGSRFVIDKPEKYREGARNKAIENAKGQAQKIAKNLGIKLGKIVNIVESSPNQPVYALKSMAAVEGLGGGGGVNLEPGSQTITSVVTLYFEKK